jgi:GT2 family glycosyltransferase/predicted O-methyltransferase YrrM
MKYSIIIPTAYDKCEKFLKPCLESLVKFTDFGWEPHSTEIIVVANGCTDDTEKFVKDFAFAYPSVPVELIVFDEAIGYPKAVNAGAKKAKGEFLILLNNDTALLEQERNQWINLMAAPFEDPKVAITGPWKMTEVKLAREFMCFFCCMIRKSAWDEVGGLDEVYGVGYDEDCQFCWDVEAKGYKFVQVPDTKIPYDGFYGYGFFPIWHFGAGTFRERPDAELIKRNDAILIDRFGGRLDLSKTVYIEPEGMSIPELKWLAQRAQKCKTIIEVGSRFGRSSRALADNLPEGGRLYCIDTWQGSSAEFDQRDTEMDYDWAYWEFCRNMFDVIDSGKVIPIRMHSRHAARMLRDHKVQADLVFIDAGHLRHEVEEDIRSFVDLVKPDGVLAGHDFGSNPIHQNREMWPGVREAVTAEIQKFQVMENGTIWWSETPECKPRVFDCFIFNNELDILEQRFKHLWDFVDRFIIVEGTRTHSGNAKELVFHNNLQRFEKWLSKTTYIVVEDWPDLKDDPDVNHWSWAFERHQRDAIMRGLTSCRNNDIITIGDCDEIPSPHAIQAFKERETGTFIMTPLMDCYYYNMQTKAVKPWNQSKIATCGAVRDLTPCGIRYTVDAKTIPNGGVHLSWFGGIDSIIQKLGNTAHRELDTEHMRDRARIEKCVAEGTDLFERKDEVFEKV